jgi:plastocyanin
MMLRSGRSRSSDLGVQHHRNAHREHRGSGGTVSPTHSSGHCRHATDDGEWDEEPHTVTSATGDFSSPGLDTDEAFSRKFTAPGTYTYFCALHPHMTATIIVK